MKKVFLSTLVGVLCATYVIWGQLSQSLSTPLSEQNSISLNVPFEWINGNGGPGAPQNLQISFDDQETAILTWDAPADTTNLVGYEVFRNTITPTAEYATHFASASLENRQVSDFNAVLSDWIYAVASVDADGNLSALSDTVTATDAHLTGLEGNIGAIRIGNADTFYHSASIPQGNVTDGGGVFTDVFGNGANTTGDGITLTWVPWWDKTDPEDLHGNIMAAENGTFDDATGWTLGSGWTISGGTLNIDGTNGTFATYSLFTGNDDTEETTILVKYDVTTYTSGSGRFNLPGENGQAMGTAVGTYYDIFFENAGTSTTNISFESNGSWNASIDNLEIYVLNVGFGDSYYRGYNTGDTIVDSTNIAWDTGDLLESDWALEFRMASPDLTPGLTDMWWDSYITSGSNRSFEIGQFSTGQMFITASNDGTTQTQRTFFRPELSSPDGHTWPKDGFNCPFWVRVEFDYDDGAGDTRMRIGISATRNRHKGWMYDSWQTMWTSAEIFDNNSNIYIMQSDGGGSVNGGQMWGWALYGDLDETNTTPLYSSNPWDWNNDGTGDANSYITISNTSNDGPSMVVTRPTTVHWSSHALSNGYTATYNDVEGRSFFTHEWVDHFESSLQPRGGYRLNGGAEIGYFSDASGDFIATIDDGTNSGSTTAYNFTEERTMTVGYSVDTNTFYGVLDGAAGNSANTVDITSFNDMDTALASVTMGISRRNKGMYGFGSLPTAESDFSPLDTSIQIYLPGRSGDDDANIANTVGSAATPVPGEQKVKQWDTYVVTLQHYDGWAEKGIQEIELFTTPTLTGTPVSRNTDIDQDTRTQFPAAMSGYFDATADVNLTTNEWEWNKMIDGDTLTVYTPPSVGNYGGTDTGTGQYRAYIYLPTQTHIRSFQIKFNAATDTNTPCQVRLFGFNRDAGGSPVQLYREDVASGSATYTFQNLQPPEYDNIHEANQLDL